MFNYTIFLQILFAGLISFILSFISIPTILRVARSKNLFDEPNKRRVNKVKVPTLGGLGIFLGILFAYLLYLDLYDYHTVPFMAVSMLIIFVIGIKDDILVTAPMMKFLGQIAAALIIVGLGDLRITDFHGFFGLQPDYFVSIIFTTILIVFLVNGFNLIDGVDGLAAITGIIVTISFSIWFLINDEFQIPILGAMLVGALVAFLYYNVFSKRQKIFMGDTGSLIIGFIISVIAVRFMEFNAAGNRIFLKYTMLSAPAVAMGIMIIPIIDTIRVFFRRIIRGQSPFVADKTHIHHRLLTLGLSHLQIALTMGTVNILFVIMSYLLRNFGMLWLLGINLTLGLLVFNIPSFIIRLKMKKMRNRKEP
jgi:UDP-N-acetylmuramyl pentapeptide phosphotransferase/UDP-N-acetylglucosamine-1-phosphate transferase